MTRQCGPPRRSESQKLVNQKSDLEPLGPFLLRIEAHPLQKQVDLLLNRLQQVEKEALVAWNDDEEAILALLRAA
jgi:hypothetical protein